MQNRYRFKILNGCEVVDSYPFTAISYGEGYTEMNFVVDEGETIPVGSYIKIDGLQDYGINNNVYVPILSSASPGQLTIENIFGDALPNGTSGTISILYGYRTVTPQNFLQSKFAWDKENEEVFFRKNFPDTLVFRGDDFNYFRDYILTNECCEVKFVVERLCDNGWSTYWEGYFSHTNCKWNFSRCEVTATFNTDDLYRCLYEGIADAKDIFGGVIQYFEKIECCEERNVIKVGTSTPCGSPKITYIDTVQNPSTPSDEAYFTSQTLVEPCDGDDQTTWQLYRSEETQVSFTNGSFELFDICATWIREVAITQDVAGNAVSPSGSGWQQAGIVSLNGYPAHRWVRKPYNNAYNKYSDYSLSYDCPNFKTIWQLELPDDLDFTSRSVGLGDTLADLCAVICNRIKGIRSDFFEINPVGDTPGYMAGDNYVTGTTNQISNLRFLRVSDFATYIGANEQLDIFSEISLQEILNAIKLIFNVKWFVDTDNYLRLEHISWFGLSAGIDTTTGKNGKLNAGKYVFEFEKQNIPMREEWKFAYAGYKDFLGVPIKYNSPCVNQRLTTTYNVPKLSTDVRHIREHANEYSDFNSFVMIACDADNFILEEAGVISGETFENGHLALANLHQNYHQHYRYLPTGEMNGSATTFLSTRRIKIQRSINYQGDCCDELNPMTDYVTTDIGNGQVEKMEKSNRDEYFTMDLTHE